MGRYCSYLLPGQDGGTYQIEVNGKFILMGHPVTSEELFTYIGEVDYSHVLASRRLAIAVIPALFADVPYFLKLMYCVTELNMPGIWIEWAGRLAFGCMAKFSLSGLRFILSPGIFIFPAASTLGQS